MQRFKRLGDEFGRLDFLIHSIAFAPREALEGEYMKVERDGFLHGARNQRLLAYAAGARGGAVDDRWWQHRDYDFSRRRQGLSGLQRDGRGQSCVGIERAIPGRRPRPDATFASTPSAPAQFKHCRRVASPG